MPFDDLKYDKLECIGPKYIKEDKLEYCKVKFNGKLSKKLFEKYTNLFYIENDLIWLAKS